MDEAVGTPATDDAVEGEPAASSERQHDTLEVIATIMLGFAAVLIAVSTYQSALWGGEQDKATTSSVRFTTQSTDLFQEADSTFSLDQLLFIEVFTSGACDEGGDDFVCEQIFANMSEPGVVAVEEWFDNDQLLPFDSDEYNDALYGEAQALADEADVQFARAAEANENGDQFELASTILTISLFFAGVSIVLHSRRVRITLLVVAGGFLIGGAISMATLEWT